MASLATPLRTPLKLTLVAGAAVAAAVLLMGRGAVEGRDFLAKPSVMPAPAYDTPAAGAGGVAILSGGCFWGMQGVFEHVKGVKQAVSGYEGGAGATAHYELVSTGTTGHAETIKVVFDPAVISYGEILRIYFSVATDPTQVGGQFPDQGPQYRGEVWYENAAQREVAQRYIAQLGRAHVFKHPITTRVDPAGGFFDAEAHHQDYLVHHPYEPYIATYDLPKVDALKKLFPARWRAEPVLALR